MIVEGEGIMGNEQSYQYRDHLLGLLDFRFYVFDLFSKFFVSYAQFLLRRFISCEFL